jgi:hypothetical protein
MLEHELPSASQVSVEKGDWTQFSVTKNAAYCVFRVVFSQNAKAATIHLHTGNRSGGTVATKLCWRFASTTDPVLEPAFETLPTCP